DIPASRLPGLIEAAGDKPVKVATVGFTPPTYNRGWSNGYPIPDVAKIQRAGQRPTSQAPPTPPTRADPGGLGGVPTPTLPPATTGSGGTSSRRGPACSVAG